MKSLQIDHGTKRRGMLFVILQGKSPDIMIIRELLMASIQSPVKN
ncbi:hypothetical protein NRS6141_03790 [Bacillus subtilis]|nr:hypothetical protein NRS6141_03790 [Bacillus subtilis]CAF1898632.1 hypothetical protein NRS6205_02027 [Bacillus subtilis]CAF1915167.1 hypothetical protein NRS6204_03882 [Bacillus subtilis]